MWPRDTQKQGPRGKPAPPEWMDLYYSGGVGPGVPLGHRRETAENSDRVQLRQQLTCTEVPEKVLFMVWNAMAGELVQFACRDCRDVCRDSCENCRDCRDCILKG